LVRKTEKTPLFREFLLLSSVAEGYGAVGGGLKGVGLRWTRGEEVAQALVDIR